MNFKLPMLVPLAAFSGVGCGVDCGAPSQVNGRYAVFSNVVSILEVENEENFPSYHSPANGWSEWNIVWKEMVQDEVIVEINGQSFEAQGVWNDIECGNFTLDIAGTFVSLDPVKLTEESTHVFTASGQFIQFANQLEGLWDYEEQWSTDKGQTGTFVIEGQVTGTTVGSED
jgi:hypothetical protein